MTGWRSPTTICRTSITPCARCWEKNGPGRVPRTARAGRRLRPPRSNMRTENNTQPMVMGSLATRQKCRWRPDMDAQTKITTMLDALAEMYAQRDLLSNDRQRAIDAILTPELQAQIAAVTL